MTEVMKLSQRGCPARHNPHTFGNIMGAKDRFRTKACPKCGWRGTENSSEKAAGFWQHGGLCAERQCRGAEKRRKKKENDTAIEAEVEENWTECDSCQKCRLLPSTYIVADGAPFQCVDVHQSCEDAGDDEKAEEELEVETPRKTAPKTASADIPEDLFTSAAFSSASMPVTPPTVRKEHVVPCRANLDTHFDALQLHTVNSRKHWYVYERSREICTIRKFLRGA